MSIVIISAFLRMLREDEEELTWTETAKRFCAFTVFFFGGMCVLKLMELLMALA